MSKKNIFCRAVSRLNRTKTIKTVAPKENIIHIPEEVFKVKKARILITNAADTPEIIGSIFL